VRRADGAGLAVGTVVEYQNWYLCYRLPIVARHLAHHGFSPSLHDGYDYYYELEGLPGSKFWPCDVTPVMPL
jgi:hypothetical protein